MNAEVATRLPTSVVAQDHKLETANENSSLELMKLRWHWTLNEANAQRVSVADYAQQVGRKPRVIYTYATGYTFVLVDKHLGVDDARSKASMTAETAAAHEAVVKHYGGSIQSTSRRTHRGVAHRIRDTARQRAEEKGTSTLDEIPAVAEFTFKAEEADKRQAETRRSKHTLRYIEVEQNVTRARRYLLEAAKAAEGVEFDGDERDLLADTLDNVKRLLVLLDRAIAGTYDKGWQQELRLIEGGRAS